MNLIITKKLRIFILTFSLTLLFSKAEAENANNFFVRENVFITVDYLQAKTGDTIILFKYDSMDHRRKEEYKSGADKEGKFKFSFPATTNCGYWALSKIDRKISSRNPTGNVVLRDLTIPFFWEKGDSIQLALSHTETLIGIKSQYAFTGNGSSKYNLRSNIFDPALYKSLPKDSMSSGQWSIKANPLKLRDTVPLTNLQLKLLEEAANSISPLSASVLKADFLFKNGLALYMMTQEYYANNIAALEEPAKLKFKNQFEKKFLSNINLGVDSIGIINSYQAAPNLLYRLQSIAYVEKGEINPLGTYKLITEKTRGQSREQLLLMMLFMNDSNLTVDSLYKDAARFFASKQGLYEYTSASKFFNRKPFLLDYILTNQNGQSINLNTFKGKVILIDFWYSGCGPCSQYYKNTLSKVETFYKNDPDVAFISVSIDRKKNNWLRSLSEGQYTDPHAVNLYTSGAGYEHPLIAENRIISFPTALLINAKGELVSYNTQELYSKDSLIKQINEAKKTY